jgi:energy-coupling factor transporter ATP-binding protein EcfA2
MREDNVRLFIGDQVSEPGETQFIARLRHDLNRLEIPATLFANFFARARETRQIDLLVRAPSRTAHVEIKALDPECPVRGGLNGPWIQLRPDGTERSLEKNFGRQALNGTYAISDAIRALAKAGEVRPKSFRDIDTIVGMWQVVPDGSKIILPPHVVTLGYSDLLRRLMTPGPNLAWTEDEWEAFARDLNVFQPGDESPAERSYRMSRELVTDYTERARTSFADGLNSLVDIGATDRSGSTFAFEDVDRMVADGRIVALVGPSGFGKSFLAGHLAVRHCEAGRLVVWARAGEYEKGRFSDLLARSMAPFSANRWRALVDPANKAGVPITVVLDGVNECPEPLRAELLQQVKAFVLRYPAGVLVTSTSVEKLGETLGATVLSVREPDADGGVAVLSEYGANHPERISAQFNTPYELSIAAQCENEVGEDASVAELQAAYIRHFAPSEQLRDALRAVAAHLHAELRTTAPLFEITNVLSVTPAELTPRQVDDILRCRLLCIERHRVGFRHEILGQFLAVEKLTRSAQSGRELGRLLGAPANAVLADTALTVDPDARKVWDALEQLADAELITKALFGTYGAGVAALATDRIRDVLLKATSSTTHEENLEFDGVAAGLGRWIAGTRWTDTEQALLTAAGHALTTGRFVGEVCDLLDSTDARCAQHIETAMGSGGRLSVTSAVAATYNQSGPSDGRGLAASYVATGAELAMMGQRNTNNAPELASQLVDGATSSSWGRLYLAALSADPSSPGDQAQFPTILVKSWNSGAYHLQLQALWAAQRFNALSEPYRTVVVDAVKSFESTNWALRSSIVEVLARFGEIKPATTLEELQDSIRLVIADPDDENRCKLAGSVIANQFEEEEIVGPYCAAIEGLQPDEKVRLLAMAARGVDRTISMFQDCIVEQLCDLVPTGDPKLDAEARGALRVFLDGPPIDAVMPDDAAGACVAAIRGWAKFHSDLPSETAALTDDERIWRLIARLLLRYERGDVPGDANEIWRKLTEDAPRTVMTLSRLERAGWMRSRRSTTSVLERLFDDYSANLRPLLEWALEHLSELPASPPFRGDLEKFLIRSLGHVGDAGTAARLRVYTLDPEAGAVAVEAVRRINDRSGA